VTSGRDLCRKTQAQELEQLESFKAQLQDNEASGCGMLWEL
jgi:hypothetical protein